MPSYSLDKARELQIARLSTEAQDLRRTNLQLEAQIQPRRLTPDQQQAIAKAVSRFAGQTVTIASYAFDVDGIIVAGQIENALRLGGVKSVSAIGARIPAHAPILRGVRITGANRPLVMTLISAFQQNGLELEPQPQATLGDELLEFKPVPSEAAFVYVGTKPAK